MSVFFITNPIVPVLGRKPCRKDSPAEITVPHSAVSYNKTFNERNYQVLPSSIAFKGAPVRFSLLAKVKNLNDLYSETSNPEKARAFIEELIQEPRRAKLITRLLVSKAGGQESFTNWYFAPDGYKAAYSKYVADFVEKAKKPDELLKLSPNWNYWALANRFGQDFTFGEVPSHFHNLDSYRNTVRGLLSGQHFDGVKELEGGQSGKRTFLIDKGDKKYVLKVHNDYLVYSKALQRASEEDSWLNDSFFKSYKENEAMRSDSCYLNAMIDGYLNANDCSHAPKLHFFDAKTSSVLYEYTEGEKYEGDLNILNVNSVLPDLNQLGIIYNDVSPDNLRRKSGKLRIIDSGESTFIDVLKPTVQGYQFELPNWSGNTVSSLIAGLELAKK